MKKCLMLAALGLVVVAASARAQQPSDGATIYARNCASCHGAQGAPNPAMARSMTGLPDFSLKATLAALTDSAARTTVSNGKGRMMPAYKSRLTPEQVAAVVTYIKTLGKH